MGRWRAFTSNIVLSNKVAEVSMSVVPVGDIVSAGASSVAVTNVVSQKITNYDNSLENYELRLIFQKKMNYFNRELAIFCLFSEAPVEFWEKETAVFFPSTLFAFVYTPRY